MPDEPAAEPPATAPANDDAQTESHDDDRDDASDGKGGKKSKVRIDYEPRRGIIIRSGKTRVRLFLGIETVALYGHCSGGSCEASDLATVHVRRARLALEARLKHGTAGVAGLSHARLRGGIVGGERAAAGITRSGAWCCGHEPRDQDHPAHQEEAHPDRQDRPPGQRGPRRLPVAADLRCQGGSRCAV